jgi:hypothetical protein
MMNILVNSISLPGLDSLGPIASGWLVGKGVDRLAACRLTFLWSAAKWLGGQGVW